MRNIINVMSDTARRGAAIFVNKNAIAESSIKNFNKPSVWVIKIYYLNNLIIASNSIGST